MIPLSFLTRPRSAKIASTAARSSRRSSSTASSSSSRRAIPSWATIDPRALGSTAEPYAVPHLCQGEWSSSSSNNHNDDQIVVPHPLDRDSPPLFTIPNTGRTDDDAEIQRFIDSLRQCPKTGLHNPFKNPERYVQYGEISRKAGAALSQPAVADFFARSIQACVPKSYAQAEGEVQVTAAFLHNFAGDNVRRLAAASSLDVPGDHYGQRSVGHRWPYGPVALVTPFNFPLEIPVLQLMGALFMGNKVCLKPSEQVSIVMEQFLRLLHDCGMEKTDVDLFLGRGAAMQEVVERAPVRLTQFTGSSRVAELLARATHGKVRLEDAGFDWKIVGPDVGDVDYVAWQCDQDAYASIGQKCSAQSMVFVHENWRAAGLVEKMQANAAKRSLDDLTAGPTLTVTTKQFLDHTNSLASMEGAEILWGGKELANHKIPEIYGACEPTAVYVPLATIMKEENFETCTTEIFAPFQVVTYYNDQTLPLVLDALEKMSHHLTAAVVSNDPEFQTHVLAHTVNGTTYAGRRARTTGAPQNHWFGPAGDPRGAGIGTPEAIQMVWSCHREIIHDNLVPRHWTQPKPT